MPFSGKTTVGKKLAGMLGLAFFDSDRMLEEQFGIAIVDFFAKYGENRFREEEFLLREKLQSIKNAVIATGGGFPCFNNNMEFIRKNGKSIYLKAEPDMLIARMKESKTTRPLLADSDFESQKNKMCRLLDERKFFYEQADFMLDAKNAISQFPILFQSL
jgi:shikimate kinase